MLNLSVYNKGIVGMISPVSEFFNVLPTKVSSCLVWKALDKLFGVSDSGWDQVIGTIENISVTVLKEDKKETDISAITESKKAPIIALVNMIILRAVKEKASDIHIEPFDEENIIIRYRIDGILHDAMYLPSNLHLAIISRVKIILRLPVCAFW